mgnify:CR=1 FL=1
MDLRVQRRHKKREGKVERDTARVFYMRLSQVRLKIQSIKLTLVIFSCSQKYDPGKCGDHLFSILHVSKGI